MEKAIVFNKTGYAPFITFLKGYAILCVVLAHSVPNIEISGYELWGSMQVPLFLLIQTFHVFKKDTANLNFKKLWSRIIFPFLILQTTIFAVKLTSAGVSLQMNVIQILTQGGYGPGSYYFWVYLQFAVLLPLLHPLVKKWSKKKLLITFLICSVTFEIICSLLHPAEWLYRLLSIRYIFLIYLGFIWVSEGVQMNGMNLFLSLLSVVAIILFAYVKPNLEPFFYDSGWTTHRWICYFYAAFLLTYLLRLIWGIVLHCHFVGTVLLVMGKCSYEIYLVQMAVFTLFSKTRLSFIHNGYAQYAIWFIVAVLCSIIGGILLHRITNNKYKVIQENVKIQSEH